MFTPLALLTASFEIFLSVVATWTPCLLNTSVFVTTCPNSLVYLLNTVVSSSPFELTFCVVVINPSYVLVTPFTVSVIFPNCVVVEVVVSLIKSVVFFIVSPTCVH